MSNKKELLETETELLRSAEYSVLGTETLYRLRQTWTGEPINPERSKRSCIEAQKVLSRICLELSSEERSHAVDVLERMDTIVYDEYELYKRELFDSQAAKR